MIENAKRVLRLFYSPYFTILKNTLVQQEFNLYLCEISKYKIVIWMIILNLLLRSFTESSFLKLMSLSDFDIDFPFIL